MSFVLRLTKVARSTWYARDRRPSEEGSTGSKSRGRPIPGYTVNRNGVIILDTTLVAVLRRYRHQPEFSNGGGVDKLRHYLIRDYGFYINRKKIYRICRENGLLLERQGRKGKRKGGFVRCNHPITRPNQLWEFDITYGYVHGENRFFFVLAFEDVFTRKCVGRYVGLSCRKGDLCCTLKQALRKEGVTPEDGLIIRSDNGPQMRSNKFHEYLEQLEEKLGHEFIPPKTPNMNAHVESFFSILKREFFQVRYFHSFADAYEQTHAFIDFYNKRRIHGSIGMKTPTEFLTQINTNREDLMLTPVSL